MTAQASPPEPTASVGAIAGGNGAGPGGAAINPKSGIPKNPGRAELGMKATLLFPSKAVVEEYYVPLIYTACRTCYSELAPEEIFRRAVAGEIEPAKMQRLIEQARLMTPARPVGTVCPVGGDWTALFTIFGSTRRPGGMSIPPWTLPYTVLCTITIPRSRPRLP